MSATPVHEAWVRDRRKSEEAHAARLLLVPLLGMSVVLGAAAGYLATGNLPALAMLVPVVFLPVLLWRLPRLGIYLLFLAAVTIEMFGYRVGPRDGAVTSRIPVFHGILPAGANLAEVLLLLMVVIVILQAVERRQAWFHRSVLTRWLTAVLGVVIGYFIIGVARGGDLTMALWEVRPYFYLAAGYLLASALVHDFAAVRPLLWVLILGSGAKAAYGLTIFLSVRHYEPRPEAVLAHEESFFFGLFTFVTVALWLFGVGGRLRVVATLLLPVVILCDMVNSRRTAWLILISGLALLGIVALIRLPDRRRQVGAALIAAVVGAAVYLPLFWNSNGTLAQPARAVRSAVAPDSRDDASNQYRDIENYNIKVFISQSRSLGMGYGRRLSYFGLVDLTRDAPMLAYVPHNGVLYVWLRTGIAGFVVFSLFLCQAMISAVRLSAARSREAAMMGAVVASALVGYVAMGATDMGFFWFRNAIAMGILLGIVDGLTRSERQALRRRGQEAQAARAIEAPTLVGSQA